MSVARTMMLSTRSSTTEKRQRCPSNHRIWRIHRFVKVAIEQRRTEETVAAHALHAASTFLRDDSARDLALRHSFERIPVLL